MTAEPVEADEIPVAEESDAQQSLMDLVERFGYERFFWKAWKVMKAPYVATASVMSIVTTSPFGRYRPCSSRLRRILSM